MDRAQFRDLLVLLDESRLEPPEARVRRLWRTARVRLLLDRRDAREQLVATALFVRRLHRALLDRLLDLPHRPATVVDADRALACCLLHRALAARQLRLFTRARTDSSVHRLDLALDLRDAHRVLLLAQPDLRVRRTRGATGRGGAPGGRGRGLHLLDRSADPLRTAPRHAPMVLAHRVYLCSDPVRALADPARHVPRALPADLDVVEVRLAPPEDLASRRNLVSNLPATVLADAR